MKNILKFKLVFVTLIITIILAGCGANTNSASAGAVKSNSGKNDLETPKKLAEQYYKDYFNQDFSKAFKNIDENTLSMSGMTIDQLTNNSKEQVFKSNAKLSDVLVKDSKDLGNGIIEVTSDLKIEQNGSQQVIENQYLDYKYENGGWYILYSGIINGYNFSKVDYNDKTKIYITPVKWFETTHGILVNFDIKNFTNQQFALGWAGTDSYIILETDKGTYKAKNAPMAKISINEDDSVPILFNDAQGSIKKITLTNVFPLNDSGLPGFGDGSKADIVLFQSNK